MGVARTVVLAVNPDVMPEVEKLLASGAMTLSKPTGGKERMRVHHLVSGRPLAPGQGAGSPEDIAARIGLTPRMLELLRLLSCGLAAREIGVRMGIGELTVKTHATRLYRVLGVKGGAPEAVAVGYRMGLLTGGES